MITRCTLARIQVYVWIVQRSGHSDAKASAFSRSTWKRGRIWMCKLGKALTRSSALQDVSCTQDLGCGVLHPHRALSLR